MSSKSFLKQWLEQAGVEFNGPHPYDIQVHDDRFYSKLTFNVSLAAGETYMAGWWDCEQLDELFFRLCRTFPDANYYSKTTSAMLSLMNVLFNWQTPLRSKEVAYKHYNLDNDLYRHMLGETMAYTCAYWKKAETLDQAQYDKFDLICRKIDLKPGEKVLELGCGWGTFAKFAAEKYGCEVTAVNIAEEQVRFAREQCKGLPVNIHLCDYRDAHVYNPYQKLFDKIVSVGLCEHVGTKNYRTFMKIARQNVKEDGLFLLHTIGKNFSYNYVDPWINKYIFPNGILPSLKLLSCAMEHLFIVEDLHNIGPDYDKTLMAWHKNFIESWPLLKDTHDEIFYRMWNYYLLSCAGGFRARGMQLWQMVLSPHGVLGGYESIR